jgi:integrase
LLLCRCRHNQKSRIVPLLPTTVAALAAYAEQRDQSQPHPNSPTFFVSTVGTALLYTDICRTFRRLFRAMGVGMGAPRRPTIHGLHHSFAVKTLVEWYRDGHDVQARPNFQLVPHDTQPTRNYTLTPRC